MVIRRIDFDINTNIINIVVAVRDFGAKMPFIRDSFEL